MEWRTVIAPFWRSVRRGGRRIWDAEGRAYIELAANLAKDDGRRAALLDRLGDYRGIERVRFSPALSRLVVHYDWRWDAEAVARAIEWLEAELGAEPPALDFEHPGSPGDIEPIVRVGVELGVAAAGLGAGLALRSLRLPRPRFEIDVAAVLSVVEGIPTARLALERVFGRSNAELALSFADAFNAALLQAWVGPTAEIWHQSLRLRGLWAQRELWASREGALSATPELCDEEVCTTPRSVALPPGPIEQYIERAVPAALGALGAGFLSTHSLARASAAAFAGIPKPAQLGREAFLSQLLRRFAARGMLVPRADALRLLDRIGTVVVDGRLLVSVLGAIEHDARGIIDAARAAELRVVIAHDETEEVGWTQADAIVPRGKVIDAIREEQEHGRGVCYIGRDQDPAYGAADFAVGLIGSGRTPWGAHVIAGVHRDDAASVVDAIRLARRVARRGVELSVMEAITSSVVAATGLRSETTRTIMTIANVTSLVAMASALRAANEIVPTSSTRHPPRIDWHAMEPEEVLERVESRHEGLSDAEADARRGHSPEPPHALETLSRLVADELVNPLTGVLVAGAGLSAAMGSVTDSVLVASVLGFNGLIGGVQRYRIERALAAMDEGERPPARVRRASGETVELDPAMLVPGDVIELEAGDTVPADCRILQKSALEVDESSLTGESLPVAKQVAPVEAPHVADRASMLYADTHVASGTAVAVVIAVADGTEAARGSASAEASSAGGVEQRLESLTAFSAPAAALSGALVAMSSLARGHPVQEAVGAAVSLAVAAVPEGLPMVATLAQLATANRLREHGVLVRNPRAIEALGRVDVLCADKTGTLTEGRIRLRRVTDGEEEWEVDALSDDARAILGAGLRASPDPTGRLPHPTDQALVDGAHRAGVSLDTGWPAWQRVHEMPFEPRRGFHGTLGRGEPGQTISVKGAPEIVLPRCDRWRGRPMTASVREALEAHAVALAGRGLRVLAVAQRSAGAKTRLEAERIRDLELLGFVALADPVRPTARDAVTDLRRAGVRTVMITGDHPSTARAIASELGLDDPSSVTTGAELDGLDDEGLAARVAGVNVFARVTPAQKVRLVHALRARGHVVAMTGDGANDAAAIRTADVGISVGEATAAARASADMIVTDEKIETIVRAVLEGRALWSSVRDSVGLLVGGNLGEILFTVVAALLAGRPPLNTRQLLLVNLITDTVPAIAVALRPPPHATPDALSNEGPDASLGDALTRDIVWRALVTSSVSAATWLPARFTGTAARADTVGLLTLIGAQLAQTMLVGGRSRLVWLSGLGALGATFAAVQTPGVSHFFGCRPLGPLGLTQVAVGVGAATGLAWMEPYVVPRVERVIGRDRIERWRGHRWVHALKDGRWLKAPGVDPRSSWRSSSSGR